MSKKLYVSNAEESVRLFDNSVMEFLSKVHWSAPLITFLPIISYFFYRGAVSNELSILSFFGWMCLGLFIWTLTEYMLHRFVFHYHPSTEFGKKIHFIFHGVHHDYPCDRLRLVLPPSVSLPLAGLFFLLFRLFPMSAGFWPFFGAFLLGYLMYDMFHYAIHHLEVKGKFWNVLKTHHLKHHYVDPEKGFGVSSPMWDYLVDSNFEDKRSNSKHTIKNA